MSAPGIQPLLTVVIATCGRPTLRRTLRSIRRQSRGDVEVIVVTDGPQPAVPELCRAFSDVRLLEGPLTRKWGHAQRMVGIEHATGRYLMFIDDDDVYTRGALDAVRDAVARDPGRIVVFRMRSRWGVIWGAPELVIANVSTCMFVVPNVPGKLGSWVTKHRYESDFDFLEETVGKQGEPIWNARIIAQSDAYPPWHFWRYPPMQRLRSRVAFRTRIQRLFARASG